MSLAADRAAQRLPTLQHGERVRCGIGSTVGLTPAVANFSRIVPLVDMALSGH